LAQSAQSNERWTRARHRGKRIFQGPTGGAVAAAAGTIEATSFYDTNDLKRILERLIDFDRLNAGVTRLSVGAVDIRTGNFVYFDTTTHTVRAEHIMASGALPPVSPRSRSKVSARLGRASSSRSLHRHLLATVGGEIKSEDAFVIARPFQHFGVAQRYDCALR
jgi:hypothetical protein